MTDKIYFLLLFTIFITLSAKIIAFLGAAMKSHINWRREKEHCCDPTLKTFVARPEREKCNNQ